MSETVAAFMLNRLHEWGVKRIYGYPGDGINGLLGAFHEVTDVEFLQCRHEEIAAFAATAHAKLTGELHTCFGWTLHGCCDANPRSLRNFQMQAHGAEMLRLACCLATERSVSAPRMVWVCINIRSSGDSFPGLSIMWSGKPTLPMSWSGAQHSSNSIKWLSI